LLGGKPLTPGDITFTAQAVDDVGATVEKVFLVHINEPVTITTASALPDGVVELAGYSVILEATGGTGALAWTEVGSGLAGSGLVLAGDGTLSGTPAYEGTVEFTVQAIDVLSDADQRLFTIEVGPNYICGDADGNEVVNIADAVYLISYIFGTGSAPDPLESGDVDCNTIANIADAVYLISFIFGGGPAPCADCP